MPDSAIVITSKEEQAVGNIAVVFSQKAWEAFSAWVTQTYEDSVVRWRVLEEANKP